MSDLAIHGGMPTRTERHPPWPDFDDSERSNLLVNLLPVPVNTLPVLVDVELGTGCIDPDAVEAAITPRTRAVIAVHIAGHPADMDRLTDICARHDLVLIEDCAHVHGSRFNGQMVGTSGSAASYSFQASKLMTGGEGGALVSTDPEIRARAMSFSVCDRRPGEWFYSHSPLGGNYRMSEWQGAGRRPARAVHGDRPGRLDLVDALGRAGRSRLWLHVDRGGRAIGVDRGGSVSVDARPSSR